MDDAERTIKKKIAWTVPNDFQNTMHAINIGKTLTEIAPNSEINKHMLEIAAFFRGEHAREENRKNRGLFESSYARLVDAIHSTGLVPQEN